MEKNEKPVAPHGYVVTCEMTVGRPQPDWTVEYEHIIVEDDYDENGEVISHMEVRGG